MPGLEVTRTINGVDVRLGARIRQPTNSDSGARFAIYSVCLDPAGDQWRGEVEVNGHVVMSTEPLASYDAAAQSAQRKLEARFVELFRDETSIAG